MEFEITSLTTAIAALALIALSMPVTLRRIRVGVPIGVGNDEILLRRIRAQGNFIEYVPIALIAMALAEHEQTAKGTMWTIAGVLIVGRIVHAFGTLNGSTPLRAGGIILTYLSLLGSAAALLAAYFG